MRYPRQDRQISFAVEDGYLVRTVVLGAERTYVHRCSASVYQEVALAIDQLASAGTTMDMLADELGAPFTQVNVALEFLKERGCVDLRRRRTYPASTFVFEDAMVEYHALRP